MSIESRLQNPNVTDFLNKGACKNEDPELFYPESVAGRNAPAKNASQAEKAKKICHTCPVITACRNYALTKPEHFGIWGGMSEEERKDELLRRGKNTSRFKK